MISCREVVAELWDYLDGELPAARAAEIADHLAECARCYPQHQFEYAFLAAVARQRSIGPGPSPVLVEKVAAAVLPGLGGHRAAPEARRPERWALAVLRLSLGVFLLLEVGRQIVWGGAAALSPSLFSVAVIEGVLAAFVLLGAWRRWSYPAALLVHLGSLSLLWSQLRDPWGVALAGLPACGALVTLYLLRDRDMWALDAWLAWRRPWRVVR